MSSTTTVIQVDLSSPVPLHEQVAAAVRRADIVVIITDPNSHGGVGVARRAAISAARPHLLVKRLRRLRASRQRQRSARRLGIDV